jgi:SNW domain-containing protein 1
LHDKSSESSSSSEDEDEELTAEERAKLNEREKIRKEMAREREKEFRKSHMGKATKEKYDSKLYFIFNCRGDRDISEKIALGLVQPAVSQDSLYDQRLFNHSSGMSSGFGGEDSYSIYDKPLFNGSSANAIYRPKKGDKDIVAGVDKGEIDGLLNLKPHKGFAGTDAPEGAIRSGPVQFEKEDVFGVDAFMSAANKRGREKDSDANNKRSRGN